ncbi:MAG: helix-turn-helix domain-containing protein [Terriglobales bacterium]
MTRLVSDKSQEARILEALKSGAWVSALVLSQISLQYSARIHALRKQGISIENRIEIVDGVKHGYFRLRPIPAIPRSAPKPARETEPQQRLFSEAVRYRDPEEAER